jgi:uncharacterized protein YjiS (DUF1127 family)
METPMTVSGSHRLFGQLIAWLADGLCEITVAIEHRQELTRLADHDDRMLADMGLCRSDLYEARSAPFWVDPTAMLQQRAIHRR